MIAFPEATAFLMPGYGEWMVILVVALLIFGRRLPEVGRTVGKTVVEFRRGLQNLKEDLHKDDELREVRSVVHDFKRAVETPRAFAADPRRLLENLTDEALATPGPDATIATAPPERTMLESAAWPQADEVVPAAPPPTANAGSAEPQIDTPSVAEPQAWSSSEHPATPAVEEHGTGSAAPRREDIPSA